MELNDGASEYRIIALPGQVQVQRDGQVVYAKGIPDQAVLSRVGAGFIGLAFIICDEHRTVVSVVVEGDVIVVSTAPVARSPHSEKEGGER